MDVIFWDKKKGENIRLIGLNNNNLCPFKGIQLIEIKLSFKSVLQMSGFRNRMQSYTQNGKEIVVDFSWEDYD